MSLLTRPYKYQIKGATTLWGEFDGNGLLADDMGLGKSLQFILIKQWFLRQRRALVVCPAYLKWNWESEWMTHAGIVPNLIHGQKQNNRLHWNAPKNGVWIIGWETLQFHVESLRRMNFAIVGADECHYMGNRDAKRTKAFKALCLRVPHVIGMSGTPFTNCPAELYPFLSTIDPKKNNGRSVFGSWTHFAHRYCGPEWTPWGWKYKGASRTKELSKKLYRYCMVRRTKEQVLKDLPPLVKTVVPFQLSAKAQMEYAKAEAGVVRWLIASKGQKGNVREAGRRSRMMALRQLVGQLKEPHVRDWLNNYLHDSKYKIIMFGYHRAAVEKLAEDYKGIAVMVNGRVKGTLRRDRFNAFKNDPKIRILSGNIGACGTGWSAKGVPNSAFFEYPWGPGALEQAISRTRGVGRGVKGMPSSTWFLVAKNTIEETILQIIDRKQGYHDQIIDGKGEEQTERIMDLLEASLLDKHLKRGKKR